MPPTDNSGRRPAPKRPAARPRPRPRPAKPAPNLINDTVAAVVGTVKGVERSVKRGDTGAKAARSIKRNVAQQKRAIATRNYTEQPRAQRSKMAAAAERRVAAGRGSATDRLIAQTHQRRTRNDAGRSDRAVRKANEQHDSAVRLRELRQAIDKLELPKVTNGVKREKGWLAKLADPRENTKAIIKGAADVTLGAAGAVSKLGEFDPLGTGDGTRKYTQAGIDPSGAGKAAAFVPKVAANVSKVGVEDFDTVERVPGDLKAMVINAPESIRALVTDPEGAGKQVIADYKRRYGPLVDGDDEKFRERLKKEGFTPELIDLFGTVQTGGVAKVAGGTAKAVERTARPGSKVNRAAARAERFVNAGRPDRLVAPGRAVPQRKAKTLPGIVRQRMVDDQRARRVTREQERLRAAQAPLPAATSKRDAKVVRRAQAKRQRAGGKGVRGMIPAEGQVVPYFATTRKRDLRKATARVASTGFRRLERLGNELSRDAERRFNALPIATQRAAVYALEGTINPSDAGASVRAIDRRVVQIKAERTRMRREDPQRWEAEYLPIVNDPDMDELVRLGELRGQLLAAPEKVLTPRLRQFVQFEQQRRPRVEEIAGDELRPSTIQARRFAPLGELVGTRAAYAPRRNALDRLETKTPAAALRDIGREIERARSKPDAKRKVAQLQAEARAVRTYTGNRPTDQRLDARLLDVARTQEADTFAARTRLVAAQQGLGDVDPVHVLHRKRDTGGAGAYATGGAGQGAVVGSRKSDLSLFRKGFRDTSGRAYALGMQEAAKRSVQWRMTNELMQDLVPVWGKNSGKGFTLRDWQEATRKQVLDPQDWVVYRPHREERDPDTAPAASPDDDQIELPAGDMVELKDLPNVDWDRNARFYVIPRDAFNEMKREQGPLARLSRGLGRFTGGQTQAILAAMPQYGVKQVAQSVPMVLVSVGRKWLDPVFWANLKTYRRTARVAPDVWRDVEDVLGVRSKSADAIRTERRGSQQFDVRRFEGQLVHTWGGLFGAAAKDWWVAPRRSTGAAGTASQAARTTAKVTLAPFRAIRDVNLAMDAWQDNLARTLALAAADARLKDSGRWADQTAQAVGDAARKLGPIAATLTAGPAERAALSRAKWVRQASFEAGDDVTRLLGDYANFTQLEQTIGRRVVPFYGFARHATRLLFNVLPLEHPLSLAVVLAASNVEQREKEEMFRAWLKRTQNIDVDDLPNNLLAGYHLVMRGGDGLELVDDRWLNPLTGPVFEALTSGPGDAAGTTFTPVLKGALESVAETNLFTKQKLSNAQGQVDSDDNPLTVSDQGRVVLNRLLGSLYPFRVWNDQVNGEKGKLTDTSLPFDAQPYPYKRTPTGKATDAIDRNEKRKQAQRSQDPIERLLDMTVPGRAKPITSKVNAAEYEAEKKKPKRKKTRTPAGGSQFGGSGAFGGSGPFSGTGSGF